MFSFVRDDLDIEQSMDLTQRTLETTNDLCDRFQATSRWCVLGLTPGDVYDPEKFTGRPTVVTKIG